MLFVTVFPFHIFFFPIFTVFAIAVNQIDFWIDPQLLTILLSFPCLRYHFLGEYLDYFSTFLVSILAVINL